MSDRPKRRLDAPPLDAEAFARFGGVVVARPPGITPVMVNFGTAARHDAVGVLTSARPAATPNLASFRCEPWTRFPVVASAMEKHPYSSQLFVPMKVERYLVVVAPPGDAPSVDDLHAFVAGPGQGILYAPGVWHMPLIVFGREPAEFVMLVWEDGTADDCVVGRLSEGVEIVENAGASSGG